MKRLVRFTASALGVVSAALLLAVAPAQATDYVLDQWNVAEFEAAGATVTVSVVFDGTNTVINVSFNPGTFTNTLLGIDDFGYQSATNCCLSGSTAGFVFTTNGNADGFGNFLREDGVGGGTSLALHFIISGNVTGDLNSADDFAGHFRFASASTCSGWAGGHNVATGTAEGCAVTSVAEPPILALAGFGLLGLAIVSRRWRKQ